MTWAVQDVSPGWRLIASLPGSRRKWRLLTPLLLSIWVGVASVEAQESGGSPRVRWLPLVVADMERSLTLYRDILGLEMVEDRPMTASAFVGAIFNAAPADLVRTVKLSAGPEQPRVLHLFEIRGYKDAAADAVRPGAIAIQVSGLDRIAAAVKTGPYTVLGENRWAEDSGRTGKEIAFSDTDGHVLIVYELTDGGGDG